MSKIVKYCSVCDESFVEKFSYCPNCSATLSVYETPSIFKTQSRDIELTKSNFKDFNDESYQIAFVENKDNSVRNMLLLGAFVLVTCGTFSGVIVSIFTSSLNVNAINENSVVAMVSPEAQEIIKEEPPKDKSKEEAGGGGGSGKEEKTPTSKGDLAPQTEQPLFLPSAKRDRVNDPAMPIVVSTKGLDQNEKPKDRYGMPNSIYTVPSDGTGTGGGMGEGVGTGQGVGKGSGRIGGEGSGSGVGVGPGIGNSKGVGRETIEDDTPPETKPKSPKITQAMQILVKPKAIYTDDARQNAVQGVVSLRVTFLANGSIGTITTISGLPSGLTEQAIAAARNIKFEPQRINGVAQTITRQIQYTFTLF